MLATPFGCLYKDFMRPFLAFLFAVCLAVSARAEFHVPDREYRCPPSDKTCKSLHNLSSQEERTTPAGGRFTINYVEYKDSGAPWNPIELDDAVAQVKNAITPEGDDSAIVMVYIHGWQNNADYVPGSCQDVCKFRDTLLARLADEQHKAAKPMKVVGIYLAWHGLSFTVEPFKHFFSYWPRRGAARHVGQTGMYNALQRIENDAIKLHRSRYIVVLAGHSFGARVLETAADTKDKQHTGLMLEYREMVQQKATQKAMVPLEALKLAVNRNLPADLIVYLNAATASTVTRQVIKDTQRTCAAEPNAPICGASPFYVAVTSHADLATGIIMPIANAVIPALTSDHLHILSAADTPWMHTHSDPSGDPVQPGGFSFTVKGATMSVNPIAGKEQLPQIHNSPFWIFNVGKDVMNSHGDVWNDTVTDLVTRIILNNDHYQALQ